MQHWCNTLQPFATKLQRRDRDRERDRYRVRKRGGERKKSKVYITYGIVSGGFYSSIQDLVVIAEPVSGTNVKRKVKREFSKGTDIESFEDLKIDDFVVHENHGIGIYKGISSINVQEVVKDYIKIEYANNGFNIVKDWLVNTLRKYD